MGFEQIKNIQKTIKLIKTSHNNQNNKIKYLQNFNIKKCNTWCVINNIPFRSIKSNPFI